MLRCGLIERTRLLPYKGEVLVKQGDQVKPWTPVARIGYLPGKMTRVDISAQMKVPPASITQYMVKALGDQVEEGEPLAQGRLFWELREARSPAKGIVGLVSRYLGHAYVREPIDLGETEPQELDIASALGVQPFFITEYLTVSQGRSLAKGQPVAARKKSFGEAPTYVMSPTYGYLSNIDRKKGTVTITPLFKTTDVLAYIEGTVSRVIPDEGVVVATACSLINGVFGVGGETFGELIVPATTPDHLLAEDDVTEACRGKVVVGGATATPEAIRKVAGYGAKALVLGYASVEVVRAVAPDVNMGITGNEATPLTLILTEGFRMQPMSLEVFEVLAAATGRTVSCNGTTHIRAGVIRPEIVIPEDPVAAAGSGGARPAAAGGTSGQPATNVGGEQGGQDSWLAVGLRVRIIRRPYEGLRGVVDALRVEKVVFQSGIVALGCVVRLDDGRKVTIPRSNCLPE